MDASVVDAGDSAFVDRLARACPGVKVLYTTGTPVEPFGKHASGVALLEKPFTMMTLLAKVREVLDDQELPATT
jgi:hypothetical protein